MSTVPIHDAAQEAIGERVRRLLTMWRDQTGFLSSTSARISHPAYQELIGLGTAALPFIFRDMEQTLDGHLSSALVAITGAQPVPSEEGGQIPKVAQQWLAWARRNGHLR
jgi:hypothetical protein